MEALPVGETSTFTLGTALVLSVELVELVGWMGSVLPHLKQNDNKGDLFKHFEQVPVRGRRTAALMV